MKGAISLVSSFLFPPGHTVAGVLIYSARGRDVQTPTRLREGAQESGFPPSLATAGRREPALQNLECAFLKALFPGVLEPPGTQRMTAPSLIMQWCTALARRKPRSELNKSTHPLRRGGHCGGSRCEAPTLDRLKRFPFGVQQKHSLYTGAGVDPGNAFVWRGELHEPTQMGCDISHGFVVFCRASACRRPRLGHAQHAADGL